MNREILEAKIGELLAYFEAEDKSKYMYRQYGKVCDQILSYWEMYDSKVFDELLKTCTIYRFGCDQWRRVNIIRNIQRYVERGTFPMTIKKDRYQTLSPTFQHVVKMVDLSLKRKDLSKKTIQNYEEVGISFFSHLQSNGITRISCVTSNMVEQYFFADGQCKRGSSIAKQVRIFLQEAYRQTHNHYYLSACSYVPEIRATHNVYPILNSDESSRIEAVLLDNGNGLSWRDRAIGMLAFYTGLRSCDITHLQYKDIDWAKNLVSLVQQKTKNPLTFRLDPVFGNVIYTYITKERPKTNVSYIFIKTKTHKPLDRHDTYKITVNILYKAGVRIIEGRRGIHLLRHNLATSMVNQNTDFSIISAALGHTSTRTVLDYMDSSVDRLKNCALPINNDAINFKPNTLLYQEIEHLKYLCIEREKSPFQIPCKDTSLCISLPIIVPSLYRSNLNSLIRSFALSPI